ncbi:hypothetical protein ES703_78154 [subsurface metagenome]
MPEKREFFDYKVEDKYQQREIARKENYVLYSLTFSSPMQIPFTENNTIYGRYYKPIKSDRAAILILHGLEGELSARYFSSSLAKKGFSCLQIAMPYARRRIPPNKCKYLGNRRIDFSEIFATGFKQAVLDIRRTTDWLSNRYKKIGILGTSLGAIIASLAAEVDGRFNSAVYILGGGDPANILWDSKDFLVKFYKNILQRNISLENLEGKWKVIDPLNYIRGNVRNILMINARYDRTILPKYTEKLWNALGRPEIKWLRATHFTIGFYILFIQKEVEKYFRKTLT